MVTLYDPKTGQPVELDEEAAKKAILAGKLAVDKAEPIRVVDPSGKVGEVKPADLGVVLSKGARFESDQDRYGTASGEGAAALGGALRGVTLGGSDLALRAISPELAHTAQHVREANPVSSIAGELGGMVALPEEALAELPAGGVLEAGKAVEGAVAAKTGASLAGRLAAKGARGAVEGGLSGLGGLVTDESLSDNPSLTAEKLFAATGGGALTGGVLLGGSEVMRTGLEKAGGALMSRFGGEGFRAALQDFAEKQAVRSVAERSDFSRGKLSDQNVIGRYMLDNGLAPGMNAEDIRGHFMPRREEEGAHLYELLDQVDSRKPLGEKLGLDLSQEPTGGFDMDRLRKRVGEEILSKFPENDPTLKGVRKGILKDLEDWGSVPRSFKDAWELQKNYRLDLGETQRDLAGTWGNRLRQLFRNEIIDQAAEVSPHFDPALRGAARDYRSAAKTVQLADKQITAQQGNNRYGLLGTVAGAAAGAARGGPIGLAEGIASAELTRLVRMRGGTFAAVVADKLANSPTMERLAVSLRKTLQEGLDSSPKFGGAFRSVIERSVAQSAASALATHVQLARSSPEYLSAVGMSPETPEAANAYAVRADQLNGVASVVQEQDAKIDQAISRFLGKQRGAAPGSAIRPMSVSEYKTHFTQLERLNQNPQALQQVLTQNPYSDSAPVLGGLVGSTALKAVQFLYHVAPKSPSNGPIKALNSPWEPSKTDLERYQRYVDAIEKPQQVLNELRDGTLSKEAVEALGVVYPSLLADIQQRMMSRLASHDKPLTYREKLSLAKLFGVPMGGAGDPNRLKLLQNQFVVTQTEDSSAKARVAQSSANLAATQGQQIEARGSLE